MKMLIRSILGCAALLALSGPLFAQGFNQGFPGMRFPQMSGPGLPPPVSPYLNLVRGGGNPGINYFGIVRPQMQFRGAIQGLQQQSLTSQQTIAELENEPNTPPPDTGHAAGFGNQGRFFMTQGIQNPLFNRNYGGSAGGGMGLSSLFSGSGTSFGRGAVPATSGGGGGRGVGR